MKYFKITDLTIDKAYYVSSTLPNETPTHVAMSAHLDPDHKYRVEEVSTREFYGLSERRHDPDTDDNWEDDDWGCECYD